MRRFGYLSNFLHSEGSRRVEVMDIWFDNGGTWVARELGFNPTSIDASAFSRAIERAIGDERMQRLRTNTDIQSSDRVPPPGTGHVDCACVGS
jgi:hypothetical protein